MSVVKITAAGAEKVAANIYAKLEYQSFPSLSNKDRVARSFLKAHPPPAEPATYVVPTSGNLGISIAAAVVPKGHKVVVVVPEKTSIDKINVLKSFGADIYRTGNRALLVGEADEDSFVGLAKKLAEKIPNAILVDEFSGGFNADVHYNETAEEILQAFSGSSVDLVVIPVESAGTLVGVARKLKEKMPQAKVIAVDARGSALSKPERTPDVGQYKMEAIGNAFIPALLSSAPQDLVPHWRVVTDKEAFGAARALVKQAGLMVGSSSGAAFAAALKEVEAIGLAPGKNVVVLFNDSAANYASTLLNETWLQQNSLLPKNKANADRYKGAAVAELNLPTPTSILPDTLVPEAIAIMERDDFDNLPILHNKKLVGYVTLNDLRQVDGEGKDIKTVDRTMHHFNKFEKLQVITPETPLTELDEFFERHPVAFVTDSEAKWCLGVVTKIDLVSYLEKRG